MAAKKCRCRRSVDPTIAGAAQLYQRALGQWVVGMLAAPGPGLKWPEPDPVADYRNRDWRQLYTGSVLDD